MSHESPEIDTSEIELTWHWVVYAVVFFFIFKTVGMWLGGDLPGGAWAVQIPAAILAVPAGLFMEYSRRRAKLVAEKTYG